MTARRKNFRGEDERGKRETASVPLPVRGEAAGIQLGESKFSVDWS